MIRQRVYFHARYVHTMAMCVYFYECVLFQFHIPAPTVQFHFYSFLNQLRKTGFDPKKINFIATIYYETKTKLL